MKYLFTLIITFFLSFSLLSQCTDIQIDNGLISFTDDSFEGLKAVGYYNNNCTASFIKTSDDRNAPAYAITNGHCAGSFNSNEVLIDFDVTAGNGNLIFNHFINTQEDADTIKIEQIEYSTMKGIDIAIVRLNKTIGEMIDLGITPLEISTETPEINDPVKVVGNPKKGYDKDQQFMRIENGTLTAKKDFIVENAWFWYDTFRNDCENIVTGSSGSPVFSCFGNGIYGIINTTSTGGTSACNFNAPCEIDSLQFNFEQGRNYVIDVREVLKCFNNQGFFDINNSNFPYPNGYQATVTFKISGFVNPDLHENNQLKLNAKVSDKPYYRYKFGKMPDANPRDINGYSQVFTTSIDSIINDTIFNEEGYYALSIIAGDSQQFDETWQQPKFASVYNYHVDKTNPTDTVTIYLDPFFTTETQYAVNFEAPFPEIRNFTIAYGDENLNEQDSSLYGPFFGIPINLVKSEGPYKVCVKGTDSAGNPGPINCKVYGTSTSNDDLVLDQHVVTYPNPATDKLNISLKNGIRFEQAIIYDLYGRSIYKSVLNKQQNIEIDLSNFQNGVYFLSLKNKNTLFNRSFIVVD